MTEPSIHILLAHAGSTLAMVGIIWFVQVVHYPLFARVGNSEFVTYERIHQRLTTCVVAPLMLVEAFTAVALIWFRPPGMAAWFVWAGASLLGTVWALTFLVQVRQHARLAVAYDAQVQKQLVQKNWYRTIAWSARGLIVLGMLGQTLSNSLATRALAATNQ